MKATDIIKKSITIDEVYKQITNAQECFKLFFPHWIYVSDQVRLQLIQDGFKVYEGEWIRGDRGLIIEW